MKLCIFDPAHNIPGLKQIFPDSHYYACIPTPYFTYSAINHMNLQDFYQEYKFEYLLNINDINSNNYDTLFIVLPLLDCIEGHSMTKGYGVRILKLIEHIIDINNFKKICIFDTYDYDYDPSEVYKNKKINIFFKRNYNNLKQYANNVIPFPYMMFVTRCVLTTILENNQHTNLQNRNNGIFWCGSIFTHENSDFNIYRDRSQIFNEIKDTLSIYNNLSNKQFIETMKQYKMGLDLYGVGDPNKRTFELIANDILVLTNRTTLNWGFDEGDSFSKETIFSNSKDFFENINLLKNETIFIKCLENQRYLKQKYMNKEWIQNYIISKIF